MIELSKEEWSANFHQRMTLLFMNRLDEMMSADCIKLVEPDEFELLNRVMPKKWGSK